MANSDVRGESSHPLSASVHLGSKRARRSDFATIVALTSRASLKCSFKLAEGNGGGGGCWNNSFLRFLGGGVVHHVSTTWKKIDRPINRNRATPPPLFYRIIERMSQRSLTPPPSPSDLPYSRFRSEIIRNRERERDKETTRRRRRRRTRLEIASIAPRD